MNFPTWLDTFVEEKGLDLHHVFTVKTDDFWQTHIVPLDVVLEAAKHTTPGQQAEIKNMLVRIDLVNAEVMPFFKFLAQRLVENRS